MFRPREDATLRAWRSGQVVVCHSDERGCRMRCGSTGLGTRELEFDLLSTEKNPNGLLIRAKTTAPVIWNIWITVEPRDIPRLLRLMASPAVAGFFVASLRRSLRPRRRPAG